MAKIMAIMAKVDTEIAETEKVYSSVTGPTSTGHLDRFRTQLHLDPYMYIYTHNLREFVKTSVILTPGALLVGL